MGALGGDLQVSGLERSHGILPAIESVGVFRRSQQLPLSPGDEIDTTLTLIGIDPTGRLWLQGAVSTRERVGICAAAQVGLRFRTLDGSRAPWPTSLAIEQPKCCAAASAAAAESDVAAAVASADAAQAEVAELAISDAACDAAGRLRLSEALRMVEEVEAGIRERIGEGSILSQGGSLLSQGGSIRSDAPSWHRLESLQLLRSPVGCAVGEPMVATTRYDDPSADASLDDSDGSSSLDPPALEHWIESLGGGAPLAHVRRAIGVPEASLGGALADAVSARGSAAGSAGSCSLSAGVSPSSSGRSLSIEDELRKRQALQEELIKKAQQEERKRQEAMERQKEVDAERERKRQLAIGR